MVAVFRGRNMEWRAGFLLIRAAWRRHCRDARLSSRNHRKAYRLDAGDQAEALLSVQAGLACRT
jgi:hypothetical protein